MTKQLEVARSRNAFPEGRLQPIFRLTKLDSVLRRMACCACHTHS